jgi:hypothetical protein
MMKKANQLDLDLIKTSKLIWFALALDAKRNQSDLVRYSSTLIKVLVRFQELFKNISQGFVSYVAILASFLNHKYFKYPN